MRDGRLRRAIKAPVRWLYLRVARWRRRRLERRGQLTYRLSGACTRCGACCERPSLHLGWLDWYLPPGRQLIVWWQRHVNGFELLAEHPRTRTLEFVCTHFDAATRRCDSYDSRPGMCWDYPRIHEAGLSAELFSDCGHRLVHRRSAQMLQALEGKNLSPEQKERLKARLHLEEGAAEAGGRQDPG